MKRKRKIDPDMPSDNSYEVPDFLPPLHELVKAPRRIIMTRELDSETIAFFKKQAEKRGGKYQRMMREVLKRYAEHYREAA